MNLLEEGIVLDHHKQNTWSDEQINYRTGTDSPLNQSKWPISHSKMNLLEEGVVLAHHIQLQYILRLTAW